MPKSSRSQMYQLAFDYAATLRDGVVSAGGDISIFWTQNGKFNNTSVLGLKNETVWRFLFFIFSITAVFRETYTVHSIWWMSKATLYMEQEMEQDGQQHLLLDAITDYSAKRLYHYTRRLVTKTM